MAETEHDPEWAYPHDGSLPSSNRAVAVLIVHKDGTYAIDIGRYYGKDGWNLQFFTSAPVVGWSNLPDFSDTTEVIDHD